MLATLGLRFTPMEDPIETVGNLLWDEAINFGHD